MFGLLRQEPDAALGSSLEIVDTDIKPLRRVRACTACRNRKLKCSLVRPQCNRCEAQKITCHYPEAGDSSKKDHFIGVETTLDQPKDSACTSDEASLKRKRVKKAHISADQRKHDKDTPKDEARHGIVVKKEKSKTSKSSAGSHQLSIHPPPTPISPTITAEDPKENQNMMNDGAWINHLLLYTPGEGLETCVDTMDMMGMTSPWLDFTTEGLGGASGTETNGAMSGFTSASGGQQGTKPLSPAESTNSNISLADETVDLEHYFTDPTNSPDMLLQSPAYTDLLLSNITSTFPGNENWTWDQHAMNNLDLLTPMSSVSPFQTTTAPHTSSSGSSSSDSPSSSTWSPSCGSESTEITSAGSPSFLFANPTAGETAYPITHSTKNTHASSNKKSKHRDHTYRSKAPPSKSTSAPRNAPQGLQGCYEAHITPLHQALERLQISSFAFLQAKADRRSRHEHKSKGKHQHGKQKHKESPPPYDTLLKSQKQALLACGALLDCAGCSSRSDLVMLVISICGLLVGSLEGLSGNTAGTTRRDTVIANGGMVMEGYNHAGQDDEATWRYADSGVHGDEHIDGNDQYGGQWAGAGAIEQDMDMDEEDTAQIIRTLTASRIAKLKGILDMVMHVSTRSELAAMGAEEDWSAHVGLVHLLRGKLRRYSGAV